MRVSVFLQRLQVVLTTFVTEAPTTAATATTETVNMVTTVPTTATIGITIVVGQFVKII